MPSQASLTEPGNVSPQYYSVKLGMWFPDRAAGYDAENRAMQLEATNKSKAAADKAAAQKQAMVNYNTQQTLQQNNAAAAEQTRKAAIVDQTRASGGSAQDATKNIQAASSGGTSPGLSMPQVSIPGVPAVPQIQQGTGGGSVSTPSGGGGATGGGSTAAAGGGANVNADLYKPFLDLQNEAGQYRSDLKNNTGKIAGQVASATGDFLQGLYNGNDQDTAHRGMAGSGVQTQQRQQSRDTAARAGTAQLGNVQVQQQQLLGNAISSALPITAAAPQQAATEKGIALTAQNQANQQNQLAFQNQMSASQQAFNQYMALLNNQQQNQGQFYTGFTA